MSYASGSKVYLVQTRAGGKSKRVAIGRHGAITSDKARTKATQIIPRIKAGEDPNPEAGTGTHRRRARRTLSG